jgi:hypothetical protein
MAVLGTVSFGLLASQEEQYLKKILLFTSLQILPMAKVT